MRITRWTNSGMKMPSTKNCPPCISACPCRQADGWCWLTATVGDYICGGTCPVALQVLHGTCLPPMSGTWPCRWIQCARPQAFPNWRHGTF